MTGFGMTRLTAFGMSALFAGALALSAVSLRAQAPVVGPPQPTPTPELPPPIPAETVLARTAGGDITMKALQDYYGQYLVPANAAPVSPAVRPDLFDRMPRLYIEKVARSYAIALAVEKAVDEIKDDETRIQYEKDFNSWLLNYALPVLRKRFIEDKQIEPDEATISAAYEQRKLEYRIPSSFSIRHIFLPAYDPHTVLTGDTLESIAEKLLGDPGRAREILCDMPGRPPRWVPPGVERKFKPLAEGEVLLVPMTPDREAQLRQIMEEIEASLKKGDSLEGVAKEYSKAEVRGTAIGPLPTGIARGRPLQQVILKAATETPVGGTSPILRTKHGFTILQVVERIDERQKPLDEAREEIVKKFKEKQNKDLERTMIETMFAQAELNIDFEAFKKAPKLQDEDVVLRVGTQPFTWKEIEPIWRKSIMEDATPEIINEGIKNHGGVFNALGLVWCQKNNIFGDGDLATRYRNLRTGVMGATHVKRQLEEGARKNLSEAVGKKYYEENKDKMYRVDPQLTFHIIERRLSPEMSENSPDVKARVIEEMRAKLERELADVKSLPQWLKMMQTTNPPFPAGTPVGKNPYIYYEKPDSEIMKTPTGEQVLKLQELQWSGAFIDGDRVRSVALVGIKKGDYRVYGEVRKEIHDMLLKKAEAEAMPALEQQWLGSAQYQFLLTEESMPKPAGEGIRS